MTEYVKFESILGKTFTNVEKIDSEQIIFHTENNETYVLFHETDCCEEVYIESIVGDLSDLIDSPITMANEVINEDCEDFQEDYDSCTWTFYNLATNKGYVTIRFFGSSNGYYSERVSFIKRQKD